MDCREVRNLTTFYVDGQLGPEENREMVEHISRCEPCYFYVRHERFAKRLLKQQFVLREPPLNLMSNIYQKYSERRDIIPILLKFAPALILIVILALALIYKINEQRFDNKIFRNITNPPLSASVTDINKFFSIFKNSSGKIQLNRNNTPNIRFVGLRYNRFDDMDAAHIFYKHKGKDISVFTINGSINNKAYFSSFKPFKGNSFILQREGKNLLISSDNDITYAVAGDANEDELYEILSSLR
ncbi:MAG: anti-sigma factor family protein [Myxococcota bacterium]